MNPTDEMLLKGAIVYERMVGHLVQPTLKLIFQAMIEEAMK